MGRIISVVFSLASLNYYTIHVSNWLTKYKSGKSRDVIVRRWIARGWEYRRRGWYTSEVKPCIFTELRPRAMPSPSRMNIAEMCIANEVFPVSLLDVFSPKRSAFDPMKDPMQILFVLHVCNRAIIYSQYLIQPLAIVGVYININIYTITCSQILLNRIINSRNFSSIHARITWRCYYYRKNCILEI